MVYETISALCLVAMAVYFISLVGKYVKLKWVDKNHAESWAYLKSFKKGKCFIIYLIAVPMLFISYYNSYSGEQYAVIRSFFLSVTSAISLVVLKFDLNLSLMSLPIYAACVYVCYTLVFLNAVIFTVSLCVMRISTGRACKKFENSRESKCVVIGEVGGKNVYRSCKTAKIMLGNYDKDEKEKLYSSQIAYKSAKSDKEFYSWLKNLVVSFVKDRESGDECILTIIHAGDDENAQLEFCRRFTLFAAELTESEVGHIDVYAVSGGNNEEVYNKLQKRAKGCLHYVDKYRAVAVDFIDRYPLTDLLTEDYVDFETSLLKKDVEISVAMLGFGNVNRQLFSSMVSNGQFFEEDGNGGKRLKQVKYYFFDKLEREKNILKSLNHNYYRYKRDFAENKNLKLSDYLPLASLPAEEQYLSLDVNDEDFYKELELAVAGDKKVAYVIVALGDDYLNLDVANKITVKIKEWGLTSVKVFVRIKNDKLASDGDAFLDYDYARPFGEINKTVYDFARVTDEKFTKMAMIRNFVYDVERDMSHETVTKEELDVSKKRWFLKRTPVERENNVYACLSIRLKLNLMGLDYCEKSDSSRKKLTRDEYFEIYARGDMPVLAQNELGGYAVKYPLEFKNSRRKTMAEIEHERWNAFMISKGFVPSSIEQILTEKNAEDNYTNGKNYELRRHGNITTFEGLKTFRKLLAERDNGDEASYDVIKYDYQILDGAWRLLDIAGYAICLREKKSKRREKK